MRYLVVIWWLFLAVDAAASVSAEVDRSVVSQDDTVTLSIHARGDARGGEPSLQALEPDFEVLGTAKSSSIRILNGKMDASTEWQVQLQPRRAGTLRIPALAVGGERTAPITLQVTPGGQAAPGQPRQIFIESEVEPRDPYVQSQVRYTIRVYFRDMVEAELSDPQVTNLVVRRLGRDRTYQTHRDGQRYGVIERRYALFPQASGRLEVPAPELRAKVVAQGRRRRSGFPFGGLGGIDPFQRTRTVRRRGEPVVLTVRPHPPAWGGGEWLPAESLSLSEDWAPSPPVFRVGEPVTRTIRLEARGLDGAQLPELGMPPIPGLKAYSDQPQIATYDDQQTVISTRMQKIALVPAREGVWRLPPLVVRWWDTGADRAREARLPGREVRVLPAAPGSAAARPAPAPPVAQARPARPASEPSTPAPASAPAPRSYWPWVAAGLGMVWLMTLGAWLGERHRRRARRSRGSDRPEALPLRAARARVESACRDGDPGAARDALLEWGRARWPEAPPEGLGALDRRLGAEGARAALHELDRVLYAPGPRGWDGRACLERLAPALDARDRSARAVASPLPPLYPSRTG